MKKKKISPNIIGEINFPKNIPNFIQIKFKGPSKRGEKKVKKRNKNDKIADQTFNSLPLNIGQMAIRPKIKKNNIPKVFLSENFIKISNL
jgi:hypothetical protein